MAYRLPDLIAATAPNRRLASSATRIVHGNSTSYATENDSMNQRAKKGEVGNGSVAIPERFRRILVAADVPLAIAEEFFEKQIAVTSKVPVVVLDEFARATKTYRAVLLLASHGYGQQGESLARGIFESFAVTHWALRNPRRADEYVLLHALLGAELQQQVQLATGLWSDLRGEPLLTQEERARAKSLFGRKGTSYWTGHKSLGDLVEDVVRSEDDMTGEKIQLIYRTIVVFSNRIVHATGVSAWSHRSEDSSDNIVTSVAGPSDHGVSNALLLAGNSYLFFLRSFVRAVDSSLEDALDDCNSFMWRAWHDEAVLRSLRDDEACPCDSRDTRWGTCHKNTNDAERRLRETGYLA